MDGTPGGLYYSKGFGSGLNKTVIFFQDGGWCYNLTVPDITHDSDLLLDWNCIARMMSFWGTTGHNVTWKGTNWTEVMTFPEWPFLGAKIDDETFYNWNRFYFIYCDGSGAQGYREEPITVVLPYYPYEKKVYFRG